MEQNLLQLVNELREEIRTLKARVSELEQVVKAKDIRINELENQLRQNSKNSHLPPSSDRFTKKKIKSAFPRKKDTKPGGQHGHTGKTLDKVEQVDEIVVLGPQVCDCGFDLSRTRGRIIETRQEFDIPPVDIYVREYQLKACICPHCKGVQTGHFPQHIQSPTQYGPGIRSICVLLNVEYKMPLEKIVQLMETTFKVQINEASILNWLKQSYNSLEFTESQIKDFIKSSKLIHADETGIKINGKLCWNHVICTDALTYQYVHAKRGQQAILSQESILPSYNGTIMHDFWSSYFGLDQAEHVVCGAHILRELNSQIEIGSIWAARFAKFYLNLFDSSRATNKRNKQQILKAYDKILKKGLREEPPPQRTGSRGRLKNSKGMNLLNRLIDFKHSVLAFAFDESIPFTNNQAERDIRHCKTKQKISGCFRSFEGAQYYARISSITSTLKKNSLNILECFRGLFESGRLSLNLT